MLFDAIATSKLVLTTSTTYFFFFLFSRHLYPARKEHEESDIQASERHFENMILDLADQLDAKGAAGGRSKDIVTPWNKVVGGNTPAFMVKVFVDGEKELFLTERWLDSLADHCDQGLSTLTPYLAIYKVQFVFVFVYYLYVCLKN